MNEPLFDGRNKVPNEEVIEKMKYFIEIANEAKKIHDESVRASIPLAREIRNELKVEYKNNDLLRIQNAYNDHELFLAYYKPAVENAYVKTTGQLTQRNVYSFLYDVDNYMHYYMPAKYKINDNLGEENESDK